MRRTGGIWPRVVAHENLRSAALRAARGKRRMAAVARFLADLEPETLRLQRELEAGDWRPGRAFTFEIHDPKRRTITAAPFSDRVVHHAVMDVLEPVLERRMVDASFACRRGKGTHAALLHARKLVRRHAWFLKMDVARCFESLRHDVVLGTLARAVKDARVLALCGPIVRSGGKDGVGLPIGNLTSQWLANLVLDRLDHFVLERLRPRGYARYMDDFVLFADDRGDLRDARAAVEHFLRDELALEAKERATLLAPTAYGLPFLGWRIHPGTVRLRPANLRRARGRLRHRLWEARTGRIGEDELAASVRALVEHLRSGGTLALRRRLFEGWGERAPPALEGRRSQAPRTA